jgi:hypothetical protein
MSSGPDSWWTKFRQRPRADGGWEQCPGLTKTEAERLLDWLEAHGCEQREVLWEEDGITVRWRSDSDG